MFGWISRPDDNKRLLFPERLLKMKCHQGIEDVGHYLNRSDHWVV